jgi:hypothetical protein
MDSDDQKPVSDEADIDLQALEADPVVQHELLRHKNFVLDINYWFNYAVKKGLSVILAEAWMEDWKKGWKEGRDEGRKQTLKESALRSFNEVSK